MELKEVISQEDMQWFGPRDFYIPPQRFTSTGKYLKLFEDDENMYRQLAVALLFKYTIRVLSELLGDVPDYIYQSGEDLRDDPGWGPVESGRIQDQLEDTVRLMRSCGRATRGQTS